MAVCHSKKLKKSRHGNEIITWTSRIMAVETNINLSGLNWIRWLSFLIETRKFLHMKWSSLTTESLKLTELISPWSMYN